MTMKTHRDKMATGLLTEGRIMRFRSAQVSAGFRHAGKYLLDLTPISPDTRRCTGSFLTKLYAFDIAIAIQNFLPLTTRCL